MSRVASLGRVVREVSLRRLSPKASLPKSPGKDKPGGVTNMGNFLAKTWPWVSKGPVWLEPSEQGKEC